MATITVPSDFDFGTLAIPNAVSGNAGEGINGDLNSIIIESERVLLLSALGESQYNDLQTALLDLDAADQHWKDFVAKAKPILARFVYCAWLKNQEVTLSVAGSGKSKIANHSVADYNQKYVDSWNGLIDLYQGRGLREKSLLEFLTDTLELSESNFLALKGYENQLGL